MRAKPSNSLLARLPAALPIWTLLAPLAAILALLGLTAGGNSTLVLAVVSVLLIGAVLAAVHHAEVVAHRVGEPYGSLVLAVAVTIIEVALIVSLMLAGGESTNTLARDTVFSAIMIVCNGVLGLCILVGGWKHQELAFRVEGTSPTLAVLAALAISYVHRHYTFVVVYGDREVFSQRARAYWLAPALVLAILGLAKATAGLSPATVAGIKLSPWQIALFVTGAWNIWHTLQQRYGLLRIYAGKLGGGTERPEQARRDRALIWLATATVAAALPVLRPQLLGKEIVRIALVDQQLRHPCPVLDQRDRIMRAPCCAILPQIAAECLLAPRHL